MAKLPSFSLPRRDFLSVMMGGAAAAAVGTLPGCGNPAGSAIARWCQSSTAAC